MYDIIKTCDIKLYTFSKLNSSEIYHYFYIVLYYNLFMYYQRKMLHLFFILVDRSLATSCNSYLINLYIPSLNNNTYFTQTREMYVLTNNNLINIKIKFYMNNNII